ncbi:MAG: hypothetical protein KTR35_03705 [Gammaproteobacteria bacterium]|nr:hypothetical protein [Gammaproteobacteria bacterium]
MSDLQLSTQLVNDVVSLLESHDPQAADPGITSQYLSAIVGFLLGQQTMSDAQKSDLLDQLNAFSRHVMEDVTKQQQKTPPPPPPQEAFGIWRPKK